MYFIVLVIKFVYFLFVFVFVFFCFFCYIDSCSFYLVAHIDDDSQDFKGLVKEVLNFCQLRKVILLHRGSHYLRTFVNCL